MSTTILQRSVKGERRQKRWEDNINTIFLALAFALSLSLSAYEFYDLSTFLSLLFALLINLTVPFCMCVFTGHIQI